MAYVDRLRAHYERVWSRAPQAQVPPGPQHKLHGEFEVLEFSPTEQRPSWRIATAAMCGPDEDDPIELHLIARASDPLHVELLAAAASYHRNEARLGLFHTVNIGRPWLPGSALTHGFLSLPYVDGEALERGPVARCLWLIPVTQAEVEFKIHEGVEALEQRFEASGFDYADPARASVV